MADKTTKLGVADWRIATFDPEVEGVEPIRSAREGGTEVPAGKVEQVQNAARKAGVELKKL